MWRRLALARSCASSARGGPVDRLGGGAHRLHCLLRREQDRGRVGRTGPPAPTASAIAAAFVLSGISTISTMSCSPEAWYAHSMRPPSPSIAGLTFSIRSCGGHLDQVMRHRPSLL